MGSVAVAAPSATAAPSAMAATDISVELDAMGHVVVPAVLYLITLKNNGPDPVSSATVVVQLDPLAGGVFNPPPCPYNSVNDTLTCTFGPIAPGATVTKDTSFVVYGVVGPTQVTATATLATSTPADSSASNNASSATCDYRRNTGLPPVPYRFFC